MVVTPNCWRLRQCTHKDCSEHVKHRDREAACVLALKAWIRYMGASADANKRAMVAYLIKDKQKRLETPLWMERGKAPSNPGKDAAAQRKPKAA